MSTPNGCTKGHENGTTSSLNPTSLPSRYQIRPLTSEHIAWAKAVVTHSNVFHSPVWPVLYPDALTTLAHDMFDSSTYLVNHQISSGHSYGLFDTDYVFKRAESEPTSGKLYWSRDEKGLLGTGKQPQQNLDAESKRLLDQMDFPLVSVALSYDAANALDMDKMAPMIACLPAFATIYGIMGGLDTRDPQLWQPTAPGQVLFRNATSTRHDYEGRGLMAGLARWLMRDAASKGFRGIQIEILADAVRHVWVGAEKADKRFKGNVVCEFDMGTWVDEEGRRVFEGVDQVVTKVYVDLV